MIAIQTVENALNKLKKSKFRSSFHLDEADIKYIDKVGLQTVRRHCEDFISKRLAPAQIQNDGRQTPWKGHPVFKAQHACACCCRKCLYKWYRVRPGQELTESQRQKIVNLLMTWIETEYNQKG